MSSVRTQVTSKVIDVVNVDCPCLALVVVRGSVSREVAVLLITISDDYRNPVVL